MGIMGVTSFVKILVLLEHAEEIKSFHRRTSGPCKIHSDYCKCHSGEICNIALADYLGVNKSSSFRLLNNALFELLKLDIVERREVENPNNRPRVYYRLKTQTAEEALMLLKSKIKKQILEKLEEKEEFERTVGKLDEVKVTDEWSKRKKIGDTSSLCFSFSYP